MCVCWGIGESGVGLHTGHAHTREDRLATNARTHDWGSEEDSVSTTLRGDTLSSPAGTILYACAFFCQNERGAGKTAHLEAVEEEHLHVLVLGVHGAESIDIRSLASVKSHLRATACVCWGGARLKVWAQMHTFSSVRFRFFRSLRRWET